MYIYSDTYVYHCTSMAQSIARPLCMGLLLPFLLPTVLLLLLLLLLPCNCCQMWQAPHSYILLTNIWGRANVPVSVPVCAGVSGVAFACCELVAMNAVRLN